jgi:RNA polymerase sigma-70 factor, ECF subfamily
MTEFEKIYKEYKLTILKFTYGYTKDFNEQEELVQDIFYNIFLALKNFKNKSSLKTYIYSIARNRCIEFVKNKIRDRKKLSRLLMFQEEKIQEPLCEKFIMTEEIKFFLSVIEGLPDEQREILYMSEVQNLKYKEIGKILAVPIGTVKSRLSRAKERVYDILMENEKMKELEEKKFLLQRKGEL